MPLQSFHSFYWAGDGTPPVAFAGGYVGWQSAVSTVISLILLLQG